MIFGNRERFALEIHPLSPTWERRYAPERAAWAAFALWVDGTNVCLHSERGSDRVQDALNVPLAPIADWIARSWPYIAFEERAAAFAPGGSLHETHVRWGATRPAAALSEDAWYDLRAEWWQRHFLAAGAEGALLPDLALARQDEGLVLEWRPPRLGDVEFLLPTGSARIAWSDAEDVLAQFVAHVAQWLQSAGLADLYSWLSNPTPLTPLTLPWGQRLELYTGRSRAELDALVGHGGSDEELAHRLGLAPGTDDPAGSPITQALRDLPPDLSAEAGPVLLKLDQATRTAGKATALDRLRHVSHDAARDATTPEEAGYAAARAVRADVNLDGQPLPSDDLREFLGWLDLDLTLASRHELGARGLTGQRDGARMLVGRREGARGAAVVLESQRTSVKWAQRFEGVRALGHALLDPLRGGVLGAASSPFAQEVRRRRSGAFAAELLLPESALLRETGGALDAASDPDVFQRLMRVHGVGARTTAHQLYNHQFLSSHELRDQLIDDFAAPPA